jgi:carbon monoxide dehydrogenase subunit G
VKLDGSYTIPAPREVVWRQLMNPETLAKSLPGCERMQPNPDGSYQAELKVGIGAVKGSYQARIEILDPVSPERYRMKVEGKGAGGFVNGEGLLTLTEDGSAQTLITYSGEAQVGGVVASVGQRLLQAAARQIVGQFFQAFAKQVQAAAFPPPSTDPLTPSGPR